MKPTRTNQARFMNPQGTEQGSARTILLMLIAFLLGVAVTAFWFHRPAPAGANPDNAVSETAAPPPAEPSTPSTPAVPAPALAPSVPAVANPQPVDPAVIAQVKKLVPNYASISLDEGESVLRAAAVNDFAAAETQSDDQIKTAKEQLLNAQNSQSADDQQAAMKQVQDTQLAAADKLKQIAMRLQAEIAALKSLKN